MQQHVGRGQRGNERNCFSQTSVLQDAGWVWASSSCAVCTGGSKRSKLDAIGRYEHSCPEARLRSALEGARPTQYVVVTAVGGQDLEPTGRLSVLSPLVPGIGLQHSVNLAHKKFCSLLFYFL